MSQGSKAPLTRREALAREREAAAPPAPRRSAPPRRVRRGIAHRFLTAGVLLFVGAMVVALSVPVNAFYPDSSASADAASHLVAGSHQKAEVGADGAPIPITKSDYTASTKAQLLAQKYRGGVGGAFTGPVRWPFPYRVGILSPYGPRGAVAGCPTCASFHHGVDLNGGNGNPIYSIMAGTVTERSGGSWTYGTYAIIVGQYQGHEIRAIYEHMQAGSSPLVVGQRVAVGGFVGLVGQTGEATAPHLHLEIDVDGKMIDPIPWLEANAS